MFPMMDPEKMKPMEEDEAVKKMASIGAIMEGAGASFGEEDMRLFRDASWAPTRLRSRWKRSSPATTALARMTRKRKKTTARSA